MCHWLAWQENWLSGSWMRPKRVKVLKCNLQIKAKTLKCWFSNHDPFFLDLSMKSWKHPKASSTKRYCGITQKQRRDWDFGRLNYVRFSQKCLILLLLWVAVSADLSEYIPLTLSPPPPVSLVAMAQYCLHPGYSKLMSHLSFPSTLAHWDSSLHLISKNLTCILQKWWTAVCEWTWGVD